MTDTTPGMRRVAKKFHDDMEALGVGVSIQVGGGPMVEVVKPPDERQPTREGSDMAMVQSQQMTLEVGENESDDLPIAGYVSVNGSARAKIELQKDEQVRVTITSINGEIVAESFARVKTIAFKQCEKDGIRWTERQHKAKLS